MFQKGVTPMNNKKRKPKPKLFKQVRDPKELQKDLAHYAREAIRLGASDAKPIRASDVVIDERVRAKCMIPKCPGYGACIHCPPTALPVETVRQLVKSFQWGVLFKVEADPRSVAGYNTFHVVANLAAGRKHKDTELYKQLEQDVRSIYSIVGDIESMAFYDGHHLAMGFGGGNCLIALCKDKGCQVLQEGTCRFPLRSRPSMESCAMDVYRTVENAGWTIYPLGIRCDVSEVKHGIHVGLVLIE